MSVTEVLRPAEYESRLQRYLFERSEEGRAVRVGEKEVSERAEIVARYTDLFTRQQLQTLRDAEDEATDPGERERLYRLRKTCEAGLITAELAEREDALENAVLAARVEFQGDELPLRSAQAQLAVLTSYADRDELGKLAGDVSATFNDERLEVLRAGEELEAEVSGVDDPIARTEEEKGISIRELEAALAKASAAAEGVYSRLREEWFDRLLGRSARRCRTRPTSPICAAFAAGEHLHEGEGRPGLHGHARAPRLRPRVRAEHQARPRRPAAEVAAGLRDPGRPAAVVHLITRAQGGLHDYQAFLHEAGHALHYAGCDPTCPTRSATSRATTR